MRQFRGYRSIKRSLRRRVQLFQAPRCHLRWRQAYRSLAAGLPAWGRYRCSQRNGRPRLHVLRWQPFPRRPAAGCGACHTGQQSRRALMQRNHVYNSKRAALPEPPACFIFPHVRAAFAVFCFQGAIPAPGRFPFALRSHFVFYPKNSAAG